MDGLYRAGFTDLDNVPTPPYLRILETWPALLDVSADALSKALMREAAAASGYGYATPNSCNIVAARWTAQLTSVIAA